MALGLNCKEHVTLCRGSPDEHLAQLRDAFVGPIREIGPNQRIARWGMRHGKEGFGIGNWIHRSQERMIASKLYAPGRLDWCPVDGIPEGEFVGHCRSVDEL